MFLPTVFVKLVNLNPAGPIQVTISRNVYFKIALLSPKGNVFQIQDVVGDIEILRICVAGSANAIPYNKMNKTFAPLVVSPKGYDLHIMAHVNFEPVNYIDIPYHLHVSAARIKPMRVLQCMEIDIVLPNYETLVFKCYIKKIKSDKIEIHILNPYQIIINDKTTDFHAPASATEAINMDLVFVFNSTMLGNGSLQNAAHTNSAPPEYESVFQDPLLENSETVLPM